MTGQLGGTGSDRHRHRAPARFPAACPPGDDREPRAPLESGGPQGRSGRAGGGGWGSPCLRPSPKPRQPRTGQSLSRCSPSWFSRGNHPHRPWSRCARRSARVPRRCSTSRRKRPRERSPDATTWAARLPKPGGRRWSARRDVGAVALPRRFPRPGKTPGPTAPHPHAARTNSRRTEPGSKIRGTMRWYPFSHGYI
ncbi:hypothetical protein BH23GEM5_BH23GEM5_21640 [soil metagenome]